MKAQAAEALKLANHVRIWRHRLIGRLRRHETTVAEILDDPPDEVKTWSIAGLLRAQHRWGPLRARALVRRVGVNETRAVGELTARQRTLLIRELRGSEPATLYGKRTER